MTQPLNPITTRGSLVPTSRKAGAPATAGSLTALVTPMAHISGRIAPIYNMRPSAHQTNEDSTITVGAWSVPYYPTHGLWRAEDEDDLDGASAGGFYGPVFPQFGNAFSVTVIGQIQHPSAPTERSSLRQLPIALAEEWDDLTSQATNTDTISQPIAGRSAPLPDPETALNAHAIAPMYADAGLYNLTCRDISGADMAAAGAVGATSVQTRDTDALTSSKDSTIDVAMTIGDVGTVASAARLYIGSVLAQGITSIDSDTTHNTSTGYTVIPSVNTISSAFGAPSPVSGQMLTQPIRDIIHLDRTCYADRGQVLVSFSRAASVSHTEPTAALWSDDSTNWSTAVASTFFRLPDVLPGSANVTGAGSSGTLAARGGLRARVIMYRATVKVGVRKVTYGGTYGQTTTYGAWNIASATNSTAAFVALDVADDASSVAKHVLLPSGMSPGDDYEIAIWWRPTSSDGYLRAACVWEPALSTVSP